MVHYETVQVIYKMKGGMYMKKIRGMVIVIAAIAAVAIAIPGVLCMKLISRTRKNKETL